MGEKQFMRARAELVAEQADRSRVTGSRVATRILGLLTLVLSAGNAAFADFLVQPMVMRTALQPGSQRTVELKLENVDPTITENVTLRLAELTQKPDASWTEMQPNDPNLSKATLRSCRTWLSVPSAPVTVPPYKIVPFKLQINVPPQTHGFYFAAIVATTEARMVSIEGTLAPVNVELVVPVILEIQGQPVRQNISLPNIGLEFEPRKFDAPAANLIAMDILNAGGTFSRVLPVARLWGQTGGHWMKVAEVRFTEITIMPGARLHVRQDVGRLLASGDYRVEGFIFVDGRRGNRVQKDVTFVGDNVVGGPRSEVALNVQPVTVFIDSAPGSTRSTSVQLINSSEEDINVEAQLVLPEHMGLAVNGRGVKGEDLGCADWVTVSPPKFSLKGYAKRSLSLLARMPKEGIKYPTYYGTLKLRVTYADGQLAGTKETYVCVQYKQGTGATIVRPTVLTVSETGPSRYLATAAYSNMGEIHVTPTCMGILSMTGVGGGAASILKRFQMTSEAYGQTGILLPFDARSFSGVLDVSDVAPGKYYVTSVLTFPGGPADGLQDQKTIEVTEQGGRKVARMTEPTGTSQVIIKM